MPVTENVTKRINSSPLISRDLSWIKFNYRVLDQTTKEDRSVFDHLKFLAITDSNLDEFFMIRVGSLYNYLDYGEERLDYSGLRELEFKKKLFEEIQKFARDQNTSYKRLESTFKDNGFEVLKDLGSLTEKEKATVKSYFEKTVYPMLTPMVFDNHHTFPVLVNMILTFAVLTKGKGEPLKAKKISFVQIPKNLPRFFEIRRRNMVYFIPIEEIIRDSIDLLYRNVEILETSLIRITRNGDFTLEESEDIEANFIEEIKSKLKTRKTGRVVRLETEDGTSRSIIRRLRERYDIEENNVFKNPPSTLIDYTGLWQIIGNPQFRDRMVPHHPPVRPLTFPDDHGGDIFSAIRQRDILMHHPYNSMEPLLELLEQSAVDPDVLSIKVTIYRLAKNSRVSAALLKAAENGKHVSVLFEVKARFDEENNIKEAQKLQRAGCYVIYGISSYKTHTKLLLIVRKEGSSVTRYVHMATGNYNESTSRLYTDLGMMTSKEAYAHDVSEFFNVITGHSMPTDYDYLLTAPRDMRQKLIGLIRQEAENAEQGKPSGICIKINSLQDKDVIEALYDASNKGVPIQLIVRGICCLRPGHKGLSENITVRSIVGEYLEHSRVYYFDNDGDPKVYVGSADVMVRSFDRRLESLFLVIDEQVKKELICTLSYNLRDNVNTYVMLENGNFISENYDDSPPFDIHKEFFRLTREDIQDVNLFNQPEHR